MDNSSNILLVDRDEKGMELLKSVLCEAGHDVETATDGSSALDILESKRPDMIISEITLPNVDGWELCWIVRQRDDLADIPFVFLTAKSGVPDEVFSFELGADDFIKKPFIKNELLARLNILLARTSDRSSHISTLSSSEVSSVLEEVEDIRLASDKLLLWKNISSIMNSSIPLEKKLWKVSKIIASLIKGECDIYTLQTDSGELYLRASSMESFSHSTYYKLKVGDSVEGIAAKTMNELVLTGETQKGEKVVMTAYPLISEGELQGVMRIINGSTDEAEDALQGELIPLISEKIKDACNVERTTLKATKLSAISEAGINIISTRDTKELAKLMASASAMILEADSSVVRFFDERSRHFTIRAAYGMTDKDSRLSLFKLDKELTRDVIKKSDTIMIDDMRKSNYSNEESIARTSLCHPIRKDGAVIGTISLYDKISKASFEPIPFNDGDDDILDRLISYAEKAIANIITVEESRKLISIDKLTSLPNAESMEKRLADELERSKRHNRAFTFALMEVANINSYLKVYGRDEGNRLIKDIGNILRDGVRAFDIIGRFWGSRFGLILPESKEKGSEIVERLAREIEDREPDHEDRSTPEKPKVVYWDIKFSEGDVSADELIKKGVEELEKKRLEVTAS